MIGGHLGVPRALLPLVFVLLVAFVLRVINLDTQDIWGDEATSIFRSRHPLGGVFFNVEEHPPLYSVILFFWLRLVGTEPFALRLLSVVFGTLAVALVYVLGRRLVSSQVGLIAAALMTLSAFAVYYSQETRMYTLALAITTTSSYLFVRWLGIGEATVHAMGLDAHQHNQTPVAGLLNSDKLSYSLIPGRTSLLAFWVILSLVSLLTHYITVALLVAHNVSFFILRRQMSLPLRPWLAAQLFFLLVAGIWFVIQGHVAFGKARIDEATWSLDPIAEVWDKTLTALTVGTTLPKEWEWPMAIAPMMLASIGIVRLLWPSGHNDQSWRASRQQAVVVVITANLLVPLILTSLANVTAPYYYPRYLLISLPYFLIPMAIGILTLWQLVNRPVNPTIVLARWGIGGLLLAAALLPNTLSLATYFTDPSYEKGGYGKLMATVQARAKPGDALLLNNRQQEAIFSYYRPEGLPVYWFPTRFPWSHPTTQQQLVEIASKHPRLWLVMFGNPEQYDPHHELERWLSQNAYLSYQGGFIDATLSLFHTTSTEAIEENPLNLRLGEEILLLDYRLSSETVHHGETLQVSIRWQALMRPAKRYTVFNQLLGLNDRIWAQMDGEPVGGTRPTSDWEPSEIIEDHYGLQVAADAPPGEYRLITGMYFLPTGERLPITSIEGRPAGDYVELATIQITP